MSICLSAIFLQTVVKLCHQWCTAGHLYPESLVTVLESQIMCKRYVFFVPNTALSFYTQNSDGHVLVVKSVSGETAKFVGFFFVFFFSEKYSLLLVHQ